METKAEQLLAYYKFKAQRMDQIFDHGRYSKDDLIDRLNQSRTIREILIVLSQQQWVDYVPLIHKSISLYLVSNPGRNKKVIAQSSNLIEMFMKMNERNGTLNGMIRIYNSQIEDLEMLILKEAE